MGKAQKKTGKGRLDKYYKLAKYVKLLHLGYDSMTVIVPQRAGLPCTFRVQADPAQQKILVFGICAMLYRFMRRSRGMASGCNQDNALEQSDSWCVAPLHYHNRNSLTHLLISSPL
jgi:hypothetical protein